MLIKLFDNMKFIIRKFYFLYVGTIINRPHGEAMFLYYRKILYLNSKCRDDFNCPHGKSHVLV